MSSSSDTSIFSFFFFLLFFHQHAFKNVHKSCFPLKMGLTFSDIARLSQFGFFGDIDAETFLVSWSVDHQGCIFRLTCSYPELTEDHVLTSEYVKIFRTVTRNAVNKSVWRKKRLFLTSLKQTCNEYLIKFSENQSAPKLENRKTSPCSPCAPNLLHVLPSRMVGWHKLCSPDRRCWQLWLIWAK